jgi:phenylacetate-CoA ligase
VAVTFLNGLVAESKMEDYLYRLLGTYKKLPIKIQYFIGWFYNLLPVSIRYGANYTSYMDRIKSWESGRYDSNATLTEVQTFAYENVPYYRDRLAQKDSLNIINKEIINQHKDEFVVSGTEDQCLITNTGGSSGTPFEFFIHKGISRSKEKAHFAWYWGQFGYRKGDKILMIRGASLKNNALYEYIAIDNKLSVTCYELTEANIDKVIAAIEKFGPTYIHGYPSSVKIITLLLEKKNVSIAGIRAIFLGSEYLSDQDRAYFEEYYSSKVINWYGHSEMLVHAGNCLHSNEYHIYPFYGHVDLVHDNKIIDEPNTPGKIIATGFDNKVMPLLQYDTGDLAEYSEKTECECGFKGRSFSKIHGRDQNYIVLNDKSKVSITAFIFGQHFSEFNKMREIQLIQNTIDTLVVHIVPNEAFSSAELESLAEKMSNSVNGKIKIDISLVEKTEKTPSGKHKILINPNGPLDE